MRTFHHTVDSMHMYMCTVSIVSVLYTPAGSAKGHKRGSSKRKKKKRPAGAVPMFGSESSGGGGLFGDGGEGSDSGEGGEDGEAKPAPSADAVFGEDDGDDWMTGSTKQPSPRQPARPRPSAGGLFDEMNEDEGSGELFDEDRPSVAKETKKKVSHNKYCKMVQISAS